MSSIGHASRIEQNIYSVEMEMRQQVGNALKYKDILHEEKDLTQLVGKESNFDVDTALRQMLVYYESWKGNDPTIIDRISINDEMITKHLCGSIVQDHTKQLMSVGSFGTFRMKLATSCSGNFLFPRIRRTKRIIPIFVNESYVLRPMAGSKIMEVFLDGSSRLDCRMVHNLSEENYQRLQEICMNFAYNTFVELKEKQTKRSTEQYEKYNYALSLRREAAGHIGIENIRRFENCKARTRGARD